MLSELQYGAFLVYSPRGQQETSKKSRDITYGVKADRHGLLAAIIDVLAKGIPGSGLEGILGPDVTLVPAPRRAPLYSGALWPARRICEELIRKGLGKEVLPCLERLRPVPKSALQPRGERPTPLDHLETMTIRRGLLPPDRVAVVDDVITKGATLLAAATHLKEAVPELFVQGFALIRTMGLISDVSEVIVPCRGLIRYDHGEAIREP